MSPGRADVLLQTDRRERHDGHRDDERDPDPSGRGEEPDLAERDEQQDRPRHARPGDHGDHDEQDDEVRGTSRVLPDGRRPVAEQLVGDPSTASATSATANGAAGRTGHDHGRRRQSGHQVERDVPAAHRPPPEARPVGGVRDVPGRAGTGGRGSAGPGPASAHLSRRPAGASGTSARPRRARPPGRRRAPQRWRRAATSRTARSAGAQSGRKTDRMPWAIHFSGNRLRPDCIQVGSWSNWKNTPEMNCSTSTTGVTIADALFPLRGTEENATPQTAPEAVPSTNTQANVHQRAASVGRSTPNSRGRDAEQQHHLHEAGHQHRADLAEEVRRRRHRGAAQPLQAALVALDGDRQGQVLEARQQHAGRDHAGQEVLRERDARVGADRGAVLPEHRGEDRQHDDRVGEDEDDGLALAEELTQLDPGARQREGRGGRQGAAGAPRARLPVPACEPLAVTGVGGGGRSVLIVSASPTSSR